MSALIHGFTGCHFGYMSESAAAAASEAAGPTKARLPKQLKMKSNKSFSKVLCAGYSSLVFLNTDANVDFISPL